MEVKETAIRQGVPQGSTRTLNDVAHVALVSAQIAGELYRASLLARQLALAAQNSRTLAARAGERAAGLDVLSEFFAQLSRQIIDLSREVNRLATEIASNSVAQWRVFRLIDSLFKAGRLNTDEYFHDYVGTESVKSQQQMRTLDEVFRSYRKKLTARLLELDDHIRTATTLASNFRLEATKTGEYEKVLRDMADDLDVHSVKIGEHTKLSMNRLKELRSMDAIS